MQFPKGSQAVPLWLPSATNGPYWLLEPLGNNSRAIRDQISCLQRIDFWSFRSHFYRTHVHMGSDHWVALSLTHTPFVIPCEDLVKTVNVVNVVKT